MMYKKYNLIFAITFIWAVAGILAVPPVWAAADDLIVEFENTPLFNEANFLPGSEVSRWAKVKNNTAAIKSIIVEAINESDPDGLADVFEIGIYENGIKLYGTTTLAAFFSAGEVSLSNLAGEGAQTQYDFLIRFVPDTDNSYQEKSLGFDILIGFKGDEGGSGDDGDGGESGGGGGGGGGGSSGGGSGGGGGILSGLIIQNEAAVTVTDITATIEWNTSFPATSRVVYGTTAGVFDFGLPPDYGYMFSTLEFDTPANTNGVTLHSIILTGLAPGITYYFRTISHASPDTISKEISFTTTGNHFDDGSGLPSNGSNVSSHFENALSFQTHAAGNATGQTQNAVTNTALENTPDANNMDEMPSDEVSPNAQSDSKNNTGPLAAVLFGFGNINIWRWMLLALLLLLITYLIYRRYRPDL